MSSVQIRVKPRVRATRRTISLHRFLSSLGLRDLASSLSCRSWRATPSRVQKSADDGT